MSFNRILLVEDEFLIGLNIQSTLTEAGFNVTEPAMTINEAMSLIDTYTYDAAVLDVNLGGQNSQQIANRLSDLKIPYVFLTGYTKDNLPFDNKNIPLVEKPFDSERLINTIKSLLAAETMPLTE